MGDSKDEYLRADMWTIKEGINLLAGQDVYTEDDTIKDGLPSEIRDFAINLEWHTLRAQKAGMLQVVYDSHGNNYLDKVLYRHVRPKEFITWAKQKGFPIPNELTVLLHDMPQTNSVEGFQLEDKSEKSRNILGKNDKFNIPRRGDISQKNAAELCGVSERTIQHWDAGEKTPDRYPGRSDTLVFTRWAISYKQKAKLKETAIQMNRATPVDPGIIEARHATSAFSDEDNKPSLEDLIADQDKDARRDRIPLKM